MKAFEYAAPENEQEVLELLSAEPGADRGPGRRHRPGRPDEEDDRHAPIAS